MRKLFLSAFWGTLTLSALDLRAATVQVSRLNKLTKTIFVTQQEIQKNDDYPKCPEPTRYEPVTSYAILNAWNGKNPDDMKHSYNIVGNLNFIAPTFVDPPSICVGAYESGKTDWKPEEMDKVTFTMSGFKMYIKEFKLVWVQTVLQIASGSEIHNFGSNLFLDNLKLVKDSPNAASDYGFNFSVPTTGSFTMKAADGTSLNGFAQASIANPDQ